MIEAMILFFGYYGGNDRYSRDWIRVPGIII
jgi:hypothetical protein